jgi:hypothetical protein
MNKKCNHTLWRITNRRHIFAGYNAKYFHTNYQIFRKICFLCLQSRRWNAHFQKIELHCCLSIGNKNLSLFSLAYDIKQILDACTGSEVSKPATAANRRPVHFMPSCTVSAALIMETPALWLMTSCRCS